MTIHSVLGQMDYVASVASHVTWAYFSFPAYKRTRHPGFLLWSLAALFGLWNSVTIHTIGADLRGNPGAYHFIHYSYPIIYIVDSIITITGTILIIRSYLGMFDALQKPPSGESAVNH